MILSPGEQQALDLIDSELGAGAPRLASMFGIFTRLTAAEGRPPEEDLIGPAILPGRPPACRRPGRPPLTVILVPAVLLLMLVAVIATVAMTAPRVRCTPATPAHEAAFGQGTGSSACLQAGTARTAPHRR